MALTSTTLTVDEFSRLPRPAGGVRQELHHGEVFELPPAKKLHARLQKRLVTRLETLLSHTELGVDKEFAFRPAPEYEVWIADVAVFRIAKWEQTPDDGYFVGVPEIVIEVLSPSDTASEMLDREEICLHHGGQEFWQVDPQRKSMKMTRSDGYSLVHGIASTAYSATLGVSIAVGDIFEPGPASGPVR
jgi:Uma2 family endonuclease